MASAQDKNFDCNPGSDAEITNAAQENQGKELPVVHLTETAANQVKAIQRKETENAGKPLRLFIEAGGCSGFQYGMVFDEHRDGDHQANFFDVNVVVDSISADYLRGAVVDYIDDLNSSGFKITNPNARQNCGCGKSFEA